MPITIRREEPGDYRETEILTREAFWDLYKPGCNEHLLVHKLRSAPAFVSELDLVACDGEEIVGNIMYSRARVVAPGGKTGEVLCLGPISVLPERQRTGIGSLLIEESLTRAKELGYPGVFLMGNPTYYSRFGFKHAKAYGVLASDGQNHDYLMGLELAPGRLDGLSGIFLEDEVFHLDPGELVDFEKLFPRKEKHMPSTHLTQ
jgi:predicted N-acetyltransferase YhbS